MPKRKERDYPFQLSLADLFDKPTAAREAESLRSTFAFGIDRHFRYVKALRNLIPDAADHRARNILHRLSELLLVPLVDQSEYISTYYDRKIVGYCTDRSERERKCRRLNKRMNKHRFEEAFDFLDSEVTHLLPEEGVNNYIRLCRDCLNQLYEAHEMFFEPLLPAVQDRELQERLKTTAIPSAIPSSQYKPQFFISKELKGLSRDFV